MASSPWRQHDTEQLTVIAVQRLEHVAVLSRLVVPTHLSPTIRRIMILVLVRRDVDHVGPGVDQAQTNKTGGAGSYHFSDESVV